VIFLTEANIAESSEDTLVVGKLDRYFSSGLWFGDCRIVLFKHETDMSPKVIINANTIAVRKQRRFFMPCYLIYKLILQIGSFQPDL
jgi:hypothetical protein